MKLRDNTQPFSKLECPGEKQAMADANEENHTFGMKKPGTSATSLLEGGSRRR